MDRRPRCLSRQACRCARLPARHRLPPAAGCFAQCPLRIEPVSRLPLAAGRQGQAHRARAARTGRGRGRVPGARPKAGRVRSGGGCGTRELKPGAPYVLRVAPDAEIIDPVPGARCPVRGEAGLLSGKLRQKHATATATPPCRAAAGVGDPRGIARMALRPGEYPGTTPYRWLLLPAPGDAAGRSWPAIAGHRRASPETPRKHRSRPTARLCHGG